MFADDVIIFSKANVESLVKIKEAITLFYEFTGLKVSLQKSAIYFGGCREAEMTILANVVGFQQGKLLFMYLGVPLDGTSIRGAAYNSVINKMTNKIKSWTAKCMSYAGRLVLVKHVLSTICSYWMRILVFPKSVLKKVTAICRNFLGSGRITGKRNLVSWKVVCQPKENGGLGVKNLGQFNTFLLLSQIWNLSLKKDSMWIKWMSNYFFKNQSVWLKEEKNHQTWILKKKLRLRVEARKCVDVLDDLSLVWKGNKWPFTVKGSYNLLFNPSDSKEWAKLIWNKLSIPKHSFSAWLAVLNKLPTRERLRGEYQGEISCCWCNREVEDGEHIFFNCLTLKPICYYLEILGIKVRWSSWENLHEWLQRRRWRSSAEKTLCCFIINAAIYESWRARNQRIFVEDTTTPEELRNHILKLLNGKLNLIRNNKTGSAITNGVLKRI
ncbi:hypothetical protein QQ045_011710 [Rhodiola kirilowii]